MDLIWGTGTIEPCDGQKFVGMVMDAPRKRVEAEVSAPGVEGWDFANLYSLLLLSVSELRTPKNIGTSSITTYPTLSMFLTSRKMFVRTLEKALKRG